MILIRLIWNIWESIGLTILAWRHGIHSDEVRRFLDIRLDNGESS